MQAILMADAVTSPDEHIFFACDMGPTRKSVLGGDRRERERERRGEGEREGGGGGGGGGQGVRLHM